MFVWQEGACDHLPLSCTFSSSALSARFGHFAERLFFPTSVTNASTWRLGLA
jgi:hypothetical protein